MAIYLSRIDQTLDTLGQPNFLMFPLHEDAYARSCLHKFSVHVHTEATLPDSFSKRDKKTKLGMHF